MTSFTQNEEMEKRFFGRNEILKVQKEAKKNCTNSDRMLFYQTKMTKILDPFGVAVFISTHKYLFRGL